MRSHMRPLSALLRRVGRSLAVSLLTGLAPLAPLSAQATEGFVAGSVRSSAGAPVAGAQVVARNEATGTQQTRQTDARGRYVFAQLPNGGPYTITVRQLGFRPVRRTGLMLNLGDRVDLDITLENATQELGAVEVRADLESKRAERVGASTIVTEREIRQLPIQDRSFADLSIIAPTTSRAGTNTTAGSLFAYNRNEAFTTNTNFLGQPITTFDN